MKTTAVIFLDLDGVMFSGRHTFKKYGNTLYKTHPGKAMDPVAVEALNLLTDQTKAEIVISSTWRRTAPLRRLRAIFQTAGITGTIRDITPVQSGALDRGEEIQQWLSAHPGVTRFVILDDDPYDIVPHLPEHLVSINFKEGVTFLDVYRAVHVLRRTEEALPEPTYRLSKTASSLGLAYHSIQHHLNGIAMYYLDDEPDLDTKIVRRLLTEAMDKLTHVEHILSESCERHGIDPDEINRSVERFLAELATKQQKSPA